MIDLKRTNNKHYSYDEYCIYFDFHDYDKYTNVIYNDYTNAYYNININDYNSVIDYSNF